MRIIDTHLSSEIKSLVNRATEIESTGEIEIERWTSENFNFLGEFYLDRRLDKIVKRIRMFGRLKFGPTSWHHYLHFVGPKKKLVKKYILSGHYLCREKLLSTSVPMMRLLL